MLSVESKPIGQRAGYRRINAVRLSGSFGRNSLRVLLLLGLMLATPAYAVPVSDLYVAQVPTDGLGTAELNAAFGRALDEVLVRVTGQSTPAVTTVQRQAIGSAAALVQQYQPISGDLVRVSFDPDAVRRRLDAAGLPVWAADRPRTLVVLPPAERNPGTLAAGPAASDSDADSDVERQRVLDVATMRGVPVLVARAPASGDSTAVDPLSDPDVALRTAGADLLLVGRMAPGGESAAWRWTLVQNGERAEWQGDITAGVNGLADRLAARYAGTAVSGQLLHLQIEGVHSFDAYGRLQNYLQHVAVIQHVELIRVMGDTLVYDVAVRGDTRQLENAFALQDILEPVATPEEVSGDAGASIGAGTVRMVYRLVNGP
ncbi:MAG: DUF2066 domain-containing protein [Gammaproteobacteria bacterium]